MPESSRSPQSSPDARLARPHGAHDSGRREHEATLFSDPASCLAGGRRARRILSSIQRDVDEGGTARVRQIASGSMEIFRIEVERPDMAYVRTTLMGREALAALLEETPEDVLRERFVFRFVR